MLCEKSRLADALRRFYSSNAYFAVCILLASASVVFNYEIAAAAIMIVLLAAQFFVQRDCSKMFYPILFMIVTLVNIMGEDIQRASWLVLGIVPIFAGIIYNIVVYKKKFRKNKIFLPMLATSAAVTAGGLFSISAEEYFEIGNMYYIVFLGFGMTLLCAVLYTLWDGEDVKKLQYEFIRAVCDAGIFLGAVMLLYYLLNLNEFTKTHQLLEILADNPFRNVAVCFYLLSMPFAFFCSRKKQVYILGGILIFVACLISGSRMGLLFGTAEFLICMVYLIAISKRKLLNGILFAVLIVAVFFMSDEVLYLYLGRGVEIGDGFINLGESRIELMRRSLADFFSSPVFGKGLGYTGNEDCYKPELFEMNWYHNFICQIVGSLGIVGIVAYVYQFYVRLDLLLNRTTSFGWLIFLMYVGVLMSGITDTGIFAPFPTVFLMNTAFMLVALEHEGFGKTPVYETNVVKKI